MKYTYDEDAVRELMVGFVRKTVSGFICFPSCWGNKWFVGRKAKKYLREYRLEFALPSSDYKPNFTTMKKTKKVVAKKKAAAKKKSK